MPSQKKRRPGGGPAERAGCHGPVVPGAVEPGPRRPLQPADGPAAGQPGRPGQGRPHSPRRAAARRGHRRDGLARRPPRAEPACHSRRHQGGRLRRSVPAYARVDAQGVISIRSIPDDQEIRRIDTKTTSEASTFGSAPTGSSWPCSTNNTPCNSGAWPTATAPPGRPAAVLDRGVQSGRPAVGGRQGRLGPLHRPGERQETSRWRLPAKAHTLAFHPDNRRLAVGYSEQHGRFRLRRGPGQPCRRPARRCDERSGRRLASRRGAPGRGGIRPAHPDLERGREAQAGDPGGPRAACHGPELPPGRRSPGLALLGWRLAPLGSCHGTAAHAIAPRRRLLNSAATASGWVACGTASSRSCWK